MHRPRITKSSRSSAPKRRLRRFLLVGSALLAAAAPSAASAATTPDPNPVTPVAHLELPRYLGTWRQIAAKPQWFEAACLRDVYANYILNADASVRVTNTCVGPYGAQIKSVGKARLLDQVTGAQLQVSFVGVNGYWYYPNSQPNYVVIGLGDNYDWAVVGDPARKSAFILARAAALTPEQKATVTAVLTKNGFDPCGLAVTPQQGGATKTGSFCTAS